MVFIKDNFINPMQCVELINSSIVVGESKVISKENEKELDRSYRKSSKLGFEENWIDQLKSQLLELLPEIKAKLKLDFPLEIEKLRGLKYEKEHFFKPHKDVIGDKNLKGSRELTAIIFLNNESKETVDEALFTGGKLILYGLFPKIPKAGFPIKAIAGRLVVFPSDLLHEVTRIESGIRYTVVGWLVRK